MDVRGGALSSTSPRHPAPAGRCVWCGADDAADNEDDDDHDDDEEEEAEAAQGSVWGALARVMRVPLRGPSLRPPPFSERNGATTASVVATVVATVVAVARCTGSTLDASAATGAARGC